MGNDNEILRADFFFQTYNSSIPYFLIMNGNDISFKEKK